MSTDLSYIDGLGQRFERTGNSLFIRTFVVATNEVVNSFEFTGVVPGAPVPAEVQEVARSILNDVARLGVGVSPVGAQTANGQTELVGADGINIIKNDQTTKKLQRWDTTTEQYVDVGSGLASTIIKRSADSAALAAGAVIPFNAVQRDDMGSADVVNGRIYIPVGSKLVRITAPVGTNYNAAATGAWQRVTPIFKLSGSQQLAATLGVRSFTGALLNIGKPNELFGNVSNWIDVSAYSTVADYYVYLTLNHDDSSPLVVVAESSFQLEAIM